MSVTFRDRVAEFLKQRPNVWIQAEQFEAVGGRQAWRTRIDDCRKRYGMDIKNRVRVIRRPDGSTYRISEYRYNVPTGQMALISRF